MKKTILIIVLIMIATVLFPTMALAFSDIPVSGDWECEYEVNEYGVGASGGTATISLRVTNTHSTDNINYVSLTWGAGMVSEFYQVKSVSVAPGGSTDVSFSIPVAEEDAGIPNTLWVGMSNRGESNVDGIGAVTGIFLAGFIFRIASFKRFRFSRSSLNPGRIIISNQIIPLNSLLNSINPLISLVLHALF